MSQTSLLMFFSSGTELFSQTYLLKNDTLKKVGHFSEFPFGIYWSTLKNLKNQNSEVMRYHHFTCVPKATIIWSTVPEIQSWTEFFYHFGPFFALYIPPDNPENQNFEKMKKSFWRCHHFKLVQQKTQSHDVCLLRYGVRRHNFLLF